MTVKLRADVKADNATFIQDNTTQLVSPADVRGQLNDLADSAVFPEDLAGGGVGPGPGGGSDIVGSVGTLRLTVPTDGQYVYLSYHTSVGDLGGGYFRGVTTGGPYIDNDGTIIVGTDTSKAWLRVWDGMTAHVGWFGAKCDVWNSVDDTISALSVLKLFTDGRGATNQYKAGVIDWGSGVAFSQPLIYGGNTGIGITYKGHYGVTRGGSQPTLLKYIGPATDAALMFYGANESSLEDLAVSPGNARNGVVVISDNTYNHTTTHAITAGADVVVTPSGADPAAKILSLMLGARLGVDAGGVNFEIIFVTAIDTVAGTFTATFTKNHVSGVQIGGGAASSGFRVNRCRLTCPGSPSYTTLKVAHTIGPGGGLEKVYTPSIASDVVTSSDPATNIVWKPTGLTGITPGMPIWIGQGSVAETVYVKSIDTTAGTFTADGGNTHPVNSRIMLATSAILFGNRLIGTVQVSEVAFNDVDLVGGTLVNVGTTVAPVSEGTCYAGLRQMRGGNTKNFTFHHLEYGYLKIVLALEDSSGQYLVSGMVGAACEDTLITMGAAVITVLALEDESYCYWIRHGAGSSISQATFIGCIFSGAANRKELDLSGNYLDTDQMVVSSGQLTFIGCRLINTRDFGVSLPIIVMNNITAFASPYPSSLSLINCNIAVNSLLTANGLPPEFIKEIPLPSGGGSAVIAGGNGRITMLNCTGGVSGGATNVFYPTMLPRRQGTATYNPPSMIAGFVDAAQTMPLTGAALGDQVDVTFSLPLQGANLRAWVSATDVITYQFSNPAGALVNPLDLGSGTVKCRIAK